MYCPKCGAKNGMGATHCVICKASLPQEAQPQPASGAAAPAGPGATSQKIQSYLVPSILITLFCCMPAGVVAIIYASQVSTKLQAGDATGAMAASDKAKLWCWLSFGINLGLLLLGLLVGILGAVADGM